MEQPNSDGNPTEQHEHPDLTREYEIITRVITSLKDGRQEVTLKRCLGCEDLNRCSIPYADAYELAFAESGMPCTVTCDPVSGKRLLQLSYEGEVFMQFYPVSGEALQYCHDDTCNLVLYHQVFGVKSPS